MKIKTRTLKTYVSVQEFQKIISKLKKEKKKSDINIWIGNFGYYIKKFYMVPNYNEYNKIESYTLNLFCFRENTSFDKCLENMIWNLISESEMTKTLPILKEGIKHLQKEIKKYSRFNKTK